MISIRYRAIEPDDKLVRLIGAEGLDASACEVTTEGYAMMDGASYTGARLGRRDIRLRYAVIGDPEEARAHLYEIFELKAGGNLRVTTRDRVRTIYGYVEAIYCDQWKQQQEIEIALACPDPWFYDMDTDVYQGETNQWTTRNSGAPVGFVAQVGPAGYVRIAGSQTKLAWDASAEVPAGTVLTLDTREGHRDLYIESGGVRTSYLHTITEWAWFNVPHSFEGHVAIVRCTAVAGTLTIRKRWAGI